VFLLEQNSFFLLQQHHNISICMIGASMTKTVSSELQELLSLKNNGVISEEEFSKLKQGVIEQSVPQS
jgi:uncharacterized protein YutE (UPF0331/DUF86 family)